jgi:UrcA family protein
MRYLALATLTAAAALAAAPSFAQSVEELTVTGHGPMLHDRPMTMSQTVSYADLDLSLRSDRHRLERRINVTAGRICDRLNEARPSAANLGRSCQEIAVRDAMGQVREAFADASSSAAYVDRYGAPVSATVPDDSAAYPVDETIYGNGPVPDTAQNRALYGGPVSRAGQHTPANGH